MWEDELMATCKVLVAVAVVVALLFVGVTLAAAETMWVNVDDGSHLNGRSQPRNGSIEAKLLRGWEVEVIRCVDGWALVDGYGESGCCWVDARYLMDTMPGETNECSPVQMRTTVNKLRVREYPGGGVVERLKKGETVTVTAWMEQDGEIWARVDGGWVMGRYLEEVEP